MSRYHLLLAMAAVLWIASWLAGSIAMAIVVGAGVTTLMGLGVAFPHMKMFGPYVCEGVAKQKRVALTFDDGPDPRSTPALLEVLKAAQIQAAFFCIGSKVEAHPELAARIVQEGHLVENHTYHHSNATNFFTTSRLQAELVQTQSSVARVTGQAPRLFRPPMGLSNPRVFRAARRLGLRVIGWTARGLDTKFTDPAGIVRRLEHGFKPGGILLLHDGNVPADRLVITVQNLLDKLRLAGYEVVRLDRLLE
jgi:peptidoglycan/xylan/chitin deacetylase (PgdA/CDA1 family)